MTAILKIYPAGILPESAGMPQKHQVAARGQSGGTQLAELAGSAMS